MCTRAVYLGPDGIVVTTRSMDWDTDMPTALWSLPRGLRRHGAAGPGSIEWTSRHGSIAAVVWGSVTADGLNERGLSANLLYLAESQYPSARQRGDRPALCVSAWTQYFLDMFATVAEAIEAMEDPPFVVCPVMTPDGQPGTAHLSLSDASGDSAILEYIDGELVVHHGRQFQVMTNSPTYDRQLAIEGYWREVGGDRMLPGTDRAADRFARAAFYMDAVEQTSDPDAAVAIGFSVIRNASVPIGIATPGAPNIASTRWRTVSDHREQRYFFDSVRYPNVFWAQMHDLELGEGAPTATLDVSVIDDLTGNTAGRFTPCEPFAFLPAPA
jgi:penicillin V acylase-like amidase (Ntn superfamily)